jgi:hypothetical protein
MSAPGFNLTGGGVMVTRVQGGSTIRGGAIYSRAISDGVNQKVYNLGRP